MANKLRNHITLAGSIEAGMQHLCIEAKARDSCDCEAVSNIAGYLDEGEKLAEKIVGLKSLVKFARSLAKMYAPHLLPEFDKALNGWSLHVPRHHPRCWGLSQTVLPTSALLPGPAPRTRLQE